ncbi:RNA 3'-phosphate cyclase [Haloterrigena turkmenica DSM 5511]|uniref:RNA 3'-terminal phosphate cyclase n=1 Tax=Haloterrigena turkmenica (strain ATCC 51198 / DSM 5511 / JCM 9101 / NCIMB 13204 / VKM B-1734 / 4k) TaxID=543526 RepID=D2RZP2_HALTV|nr:RNA 3'-terminal phosphate cyclase [Haloterrigena turkmenica]ADB62081.1 RNA 3'-phosphate cyclase [Haloterrigena turkmenica DSM 5511]
MTIDLDGATAGGQFVRTALTLSVLENEPVRIENVRGNRSTPGLRHQHLAVLETMAAVCDADVSGAELGAETVEFEPGLESTADASGWSGAGRGRLAGGTYEVDIGTAGSATLLFDALLPLASVLESQLSVTVTGGTDVAWSPPLDYVRRVKLPLLRRVGLTAAVEVDRRGFYPDGGGRATLHLAPSTLEPIELAERGPLEGVRLYSTESASLADRDVAYRQAEGALERLALAEADLEVVDRCERTVESPSPGSAIVLRVDHGTGIAGFTALGERGKPAERVGEDAADAANRFLKRDIEAGSGPAPVDRHMADQLLVFLALAGGRVRIPAVTDHVATSRELLEAFGADLRLELERDAPNGTEGETDHTADAARPALVTVDSTIDS